MDTRAADPVEEANKKRPFFLINRNFALLWSGQIISMVGDLIFSTTLLLWITTQVARSQPWAPLAVSGLFLSAALPVFLIGPFTGVFVDRWNRRLTMLLTDALRTLLILLLLLLALLIFPSHSTSSSSLPILQLASVFSIVIAASICSQFFNPARFALLGTIIVEADQARASGLMQIPESVSAFIGPILGTILFFTVGIFWAFFFNALSFAVSFLALLAIRHAGESTPKVAVERKGIMREFVDGLRFSWNNPFLRIFILAGPLLVLNEGALSTLDIFFVMQNLHTSVKFFALLGVAFGLGFSITAIIAPYILKYLGPTKSYIISYVLEGCIMIIYSRLSGFLFAIIITFLFGFLVGIVNTAQMQTILRVTPSAFLGRFTAIRTPILTAVLMLTSTVAGSLVSIVLRGFHYTLWGFVFRPVDTIYTITGILTIVGGIYVFLSLRSTMNSMNQK